MKFTLLFYTDGWESGPTVELSHIPAPGSIVWTADAMEDGQQLHIEKLDDIVLALEQMKEQL